MRRATTALIVAAIGVFWACGPAAAQYPPGTTTSTPPGPTTTFNTPPGQPPGVPPSSAPGNPPTSANPKARNNDRGVLVGGTKFNNEVCGFQPNSTVTVTFNGTNVEQQTTDANGCARQVVETSCPPAATIDGHRFDAKAADENRLVVSGTGADGQPLSQTDTFGVRCVGGKSAFTGANVLRWTIAALVLIAIGALFVVADRRRGHRHVAP